MCVRRTTRCLLCNQSTSSALIGTGNGKSEELSELFEVFCDYLKLDPDRKLRNAYPGRLFPFCPGCCFNVYQLFDYHKEKVRILEKLSQVVVSMTTLILESDESDSEPDSSHSVRAGPASETLAGEIKGLRKCVVQNYNPKVRLKAYKPSKIQAVKVESTFDGLTGNKCLDDSTAGLKKSGKVKINKVSADLSSENILEGSLQRRTKGSKAELFAKIEKENNISDSDADFGVGEAQDDSMDMDYGNGGDADDLNASKSDESDDSMSESSGDEGNLRTTTKFRVTATGKKMRPPTFPVKIDESTYSFGNYKYKVNGSEFTCESCFHTASSFKRMRSHLREQHILNIPPIPEKPMEEYKVGKNTYVLADKYNFEKVGKKEFRCSTCKHSANTWSKMYNHVRELHFRPMRRPALENKTFVRPRGAIVPLGGSEFEYLGFKYSVQQHGCHTCLTCGALKFTLFCMHGHIRRSHVDFLPEVPDKSLEDYEIHPNLFCLSRRYMFERTGDDSFDCTFSECNLVTPTWEEMYTHIRADHYFPLERSQVKYRGGRRSENEKSSASSLAPNPPQKVVKEGEADGNAGEPASNPVSDHEEATGSRSTLDPTREETEEHLPETGGNSPGAEGEAPLPEAQTSAQSGRLLHRRRRSNMPSKPDPSKEAQGLADIEISPGHYSYQNWKFHLMDGKFMCDSCDASFQTKKLILGHINSVHMRNTGFRKTGPNEYLYRGTYPGIRDDETGKFRCRAQDCESIHSYPTLRSLRIHISNVHIKGPTKRNIPLHLVEARREKLRTDQEDLKIALAKHRVGTNQYSFKGVGFEFRDDDEGGKFYCEACGSGHQLQIREHIRNKHFPRNPNVKSKSWRRLPEDEKLNFEEVGPGEFLVGAEFRIHRLPEGKYKCDVEGCESVLVSKESTRSHIRLVHQARPEICELCGKVYKNARILEVHRAVYHVEGEKQPCPQCPKVFPNPLALKKHLASHRFTARSKFIHQCDSCGKAYKSLKSLEYHITMNHTEDKPTFPCDKCDKVYGAPLSLKVHIKHDHLDGGKKTHPCPVCQKEFKYKETVRRHILVVHEGKKSSEVYKRNKKPGSSRVTSTVRRRTTKRKMKTETDEDHTDSSMEMESEDNPNAGEDDPMDFQNLIGF